MRSFSSGAILASDEAISVSYTLSSLAYRSRRLDDDALDTVGSRTATLLGSGAALELHPMTTRRIPAERTGLVSMMRSVDAHNLGLTFAEAPASSCALYHVAQE